MHAGCHHVPFCRDRHGKLHYLYSYLSGMMISFLLLPLLLHTRFQSFAYALLCTRVCTDPAAMSYLQSEVGCSFLCSSALNTHHCYLVFTVYFIEFLIC